jgi:two-component system chemotaxis response regulator CheB
LDKDSIYRVLIVDDSKVARSTLVRWLANEPNIRVVGEAKDGFEALTALKVLDPDVVILDVEMPGISGIEVLRRIHRYDAKKTVIMFSATTKRGAAATIEALALGAADYVTKPSSSGDQGSSVDAIRYDLVTKIKVLGSQRLRHEAKAPLERFRPPNSIKSDERQSDDKGQVGISPRSGHDAAGQSRQLGGNLNNTARVPKQSAKGANGLDSGLGKTMVAAKRVEAVVIASSTGGPAALTEIVPKLPSDLAVPVLIVQHMPALFAEMLAERLDGRSALNVAIAEEGVAVTAGTIYIAPGGRHLEVVQRGAREIVCHLGDGPPEQSCRPSANVLFRSAAQVWHSHLLGVVLTGMGADGCDGSEAIVRQGGSVIVQDEATSVIWGMPGAVAKAGLASASLPLQAIAGEIYQRTKFKTHVLDTSLDRK